MKLNREGITISPKVTPTFSYLLANPVALLGFGFGSGLSPIMPGTVGTLAAVPLYLLMSTLAWPWYLAIVLTSCVVGVYICGVTATKLGVHDYGGIVWDEFAGFWITMIAAPSGWPWVLVGFVLFRIFDMVKPWPINIVDRHVDGGFGIMLDDVIAGALAAATLQCVYLAYSRWI